MIKGATVVRNGRSSVEAGYMANCSRSSSVDTMKRVCAAGGERREGEWRDCVERFYECGEIEAYLASFRYLAR